MSHEIETHGTQAAAVFAREDAWHKLGTTLPDAFTAEQAMTVGHLGGWNVRKIDLIGRELTDDGVTEVSAGSDQYMVVRDDPWEPNKVNYLGVVGNGYTPIQNEEHADLLNALVHESGAHFETAGSLRGGREVFLTMKLPDHLLIGGIDRLDAYIVAMNSHDGSSAFRFLTTSVRVVCANTQAAAIRNNFGMFSIRHTSGAHAALQQARDALKFSLKYNAEFEQEAERMIQTTLTADEFRKIIEESYGVEEDATDRVKKNAEEFLDELTGLFVSSDTMSDIRDTRWAAYQSFTEFADHFATVRFKGRTAEEVRAEKAIGDADTRRFKADAFNLFRVPVLVKAGK